jgi:hypothetical protein
VPKSKKKAGAKMPASVSGQSKIYLLVSLRLFEFVLNVFLDAPGLSFTFWINFLGATHFAFLVLCGFVGSASDVVLRSFGFLSSITLGHVSSIPRLVRYEDSSSRRFLFRRASTTLRIILPQPRRASSDNARVGGRTGLSTVSELRLLPSRFCS